MAERREEVFAFPFAIDGDRVHGLTVRLSMNRDSSWTKALKFMLADLKQALVWTNRCALLTAPPLAPLAPEAAGWGAAG